MKTITLTSETPSTGLLRRDYDIVQLVNTEAVTEEYLSLARGLLKRNGILCVTVPAGLDTSKNVVAVAKTRRKIEAAGFFVTDIRLDILTITATPEITVEDIIVYGPPGVGDILWSLNKLKAIREREAPCRIKYVVCANGFGSDRSRDLLNNCGLIDSFDFQELPLPRGLVCPDAREAAYNLFANPHVDAGKPIVEWLPEYPCDFDIKFDIPKTALAQVDARMKGRKFATVYFSSVAWNDECTGGQAWGPEDWADICIYLNDSGLKPVVLGREWDVSYADRVAEQIIQAGRAPSEVWLNMIGRTKLLLAQAFMKRAEVNVGSGSSGLTVLAGYLGSKMLTLWPKPGVLPIEPYLCSLIKDGFSSCWVPPEIKEAGTYIPLHFGEFTRDDVKQNIQNLLAKGSHVNVV